VIPDTTGFRAALEAELAVATRGVTASVQANVAGTAAAAQAAALSGVGGGTGAAGGKAAKGINDLTKESQALRGSLIGLSRVTPVTVFGLGVYGTAAIAVGYAIKGAIRSTADFEHQLNVFQATTGATAGQMERVAALSKQLGADLSLPSTSAGDAALAMTELAKAGLSVNDTLAGSRGVLQLAAAAQLDVGTAANFVATELNAFGLQGSKAAHIADLLAGASIAAQGDIRDFGTAFQQVSAVANTADVSIETTTGALTELALAGLKGADGGTSLRTMLLRLTPTTKQAAQYQKALGIELDQNATIGAQLPDLIDQYKEALAALTPVQRQQALTQIFGQDAYRAAAIIIDGGSAALRRNTEAANQNGAANTLAQANAKGLSGAFNGLKSNLDTLGITLGDFVKGPLEKLTRNFSDGVTLIDELIKKVEELDNKLPTWLGGSGDKGGKGGGEDSGPEKALKRLFTTGPTFLKGLRDTLTVFNKGGRIEFGETPAEARKRIEEEIKARTRLAKLQRENGLFGASTFRPSQAFKDQTAGTIRDPGQFGITDLSQKIVLTKEQKKRRDAIVKLIEAGKEPTKLDLSPPNPLLISQYNAQIQESLALELKADKVIEAYFQKRLDRAVVGSEKYTQILGRLQQAHAATSAVQDQIDANIAAAAAERKAKQDAADAERKRLAAEAKQRTRDIFNLQVSKLDLAIDQAGLTKPIRDDIARNRDKIRFYNRQIDRINDIKKRRKLTLEEQQALIDYATAIAATKRTIQGLKKDKDKDGGFTLGELFKEASDAFKTFGSNINARNGVLSPQDERAAFGKSLLDKRKPRDPIGPASFASSAHQRGLGLGQATLTEAQKQTMLLRLIADRLRIPDPTTREAKLIAKYPINASRAWSRARAGQESGAYT
jgi:TP901 family phage tail tape measure protein